MKKALLTVNIITYNHVKYIEECIKSILAQKTNFKFIIRIFDDCSTDGTTEICEKYANKYPKKIQLYKADHNLGVKRGVYVNALRSYENIKTPYYMFIEGDDYRINKHGLQIQIDALEQHPECNFCASKTTNTTVYPYSYPALQEGVYSKSDIVSNPEIYFFTSLMSRVVRTTSIKIDKNHPNYYIVDIPQFFELINQENSKMYFIDDTFCYYRETGEGFVTGTTFWKRILHNAKELSNYNNYTNNIFDLTLQKILIEEIYWINQKALNKQYINTNNNLKINAPIPQTKRLQNKIKMIKHYLLPPLVIDIFNLPRDIIRKVKAKGKIRRYFLAPIVLDLLNIPRDIIRKIRKWKGNK